MLAYKNNKIKSCYNISPTDEEVKNYINLLEKSSKPRQKKEFTEEYKTWSKWLSSRFGEKGSLNLVVDFKEYTRLVDGTKEYISNKTIQETTRRIRNKINKIAYGNASRRFGKELTIIINYHSFPQKHLHLLIEIPDKFNTPILENEFKSKIREVCRQDKWLKRKKNYLEDTDTILGSTHYNGKGSIDTAVIF